MVAEKGADLIKELWLQESVVRAEAEASGQITGAAVQTTATGNAYVPSAAAFDGYSTAESKKVQVKATANATAG